MITQSLWSFCCPRNFLMQQTGMIMPSQRKRKGKEEKGQLQSKREKINTNKIPCHSRFVNIHYILHRMKSNYFQTITSAEKVTQFKLEAEKMERACSTKGDTANVATSQEEVLPGEFVKAHTKKTDTKQKAHKQQASSTALEAMVGSKINNYYMLQPDNELISETH